MLNIKHFLGLDYYSSPLDQFLDNFDKTHPKLSNSQQFEKEKYEKIDCLRDDVQITTKKHSQGN